MRTFLKIAGFSAIAIISSLNANAKAEKFILDPTHTNITWSANHFGFSNPNGKFAKSSGILLLNEKNPTKSSVTIEIDTDSIITGLAAFDSHLKSADFFNVKKFKTAKFVSTKVEVIDEVNAKVYGNLTLIGVTKPVTLEMHFNKVGEHPFTKKKTVGFSAMTTIKRSEFGMGYGIPMISDEIKLSIEVEANVK